MRRPIFCVALLLAMGAVPGLGAPPATRPATRPATQPARMTTEQVTAFDGHFLGAKWDDVAAKLKATGAVASGPTLLTDGGKGKFRRTLYSVGMGYSFEYGEYSVTIDNAGLVYKYQFTPAHWPPPPGTDAYDARDLEYKLKPGNKWWLVKSRTFTRADASNVTLELTQARTADEAAQKLIAKRKQRAARTAKAMKTEVQDWLAKMADVEVHEWFTPQIQQHQEERVD